MASAAERVTDMQTPHPQPLSPSTGPGELACRKRELRVPLSQLLLRWSAVLLLCALTWQVICPSCQAQFGARSRDILAMYLFNGTDEATFRRRLEHSTQVRIDRIAEVVGLDEAQRAKLDLANQGDLCRFYREIDQVREKVKGLDPQNNNDLQAAWVHIMPVRERLTKGIIDENSLSERILQNLLNDDQQAQYKQFRRERRIAQFRAVVRMSIAELEESVPLTEKQRTGLIKLLDERIERIPPENRFADQQLKAYYGYILLAQLPNDRLSELLDVQQIDTLQKLIAPYDNFRLQP